MKKKNKHRHAYLKLFLPFALFSSLCILISAVVISLIFGVSMEEAYFESDFYRLTANAVSIALLVFSISFFFSCILAYRPVKMMMVENEDLSENEKAAKTELVKKFLYELCVYGKTEHELEQLTVSEDFPLDFSAPAGLYLVFLDRFRTFLQMPARSQTELLDAVETIFSDAMRGHYSSVSVASPDRRSIIMIYNENPEETLGDFSRRLEAAKETFLQRTGSSVTVVYHLAAVNVSRLDSAYQSCSQGIRRRLFTGWNSLIPVPEAPIKAEISQEVFLDELRKLNDCLIHGSPMVPHAFSMLLDRFDGDWLGYQTALLSVRGQLEQDILILENVRKTASMEAMREALVFDGCETTEEINTILQNVIRFIEEEYKNADQLRQQGYIDKAEQLIRDHYQNCEYGVSQIAADLGLSHTYISKLYKEMTGANMIDRLTQYRMEAAVSLLLKSDIAVTEIYRLVGYSSVNYFYRVFKRYYGVTPGQYREMRKEGKNDETKKSL